MIQRSYGALLGVAIVAVVLLAEAAVAAPRAGIVLAVLGSAERIRQAQPTAIARGSVIEVGDAVVTGSGARVQLRMVDGTVIQLGAGTRFSVDRYDHDPGGSQPVTVVLALVTGAFRAVTAATSGTLDLAVTTPVATIGIRGTDFWGGFEFGSALDVALLAGGPITVGNSAGEVLIENPGDGTTVQDVATPPTVPVAWPAEKIRRAQAATALAPP